jgi:hypothetical protein
MQTICRLIALSSSDAASLRATPASLAERLRSATAHSDVYRYWHAIEYLLAKHRPGGAASKWLTIGASVSEALGDVPGARLLSASQVSELDAELRGIQPDELAAYYDSAALDAANVYPATWQAWEEDFDPLGQVLEHYSFLQQFTARCAASRSALLLHFELLAEGSV